MKSTSPERAAAIAAGQTKYRGTTVCKKCGGVERYVRTYNCVACAGGKPISTTPARSKNAFGWVFRSSSKSKVAAPDKIAGEDAAIAAYIAKKGVTRCPTAAVDVTTATIPKSKTLENYVAALTDREEAEAARRSKAVKKSMTANARLRRATSRRKVA
jgi:hypothetical protein